MSRQPGSQADKGTVCDVLTSHLFALYLCLHLLAQVWEGTLGWGGPGARCPAAGAAQCVGLLWGKVGQQDAAGSLHRARLRAAHLPPQLHLGEDYSDPEWWQLYRGG
jgi:hypothetical protein